MAAAASRKMSALPTRFETREDGGELYIEGYFVVFGAEYELWPGAVETVLPGAFQKTLDRDIRALCDHDSRLVLGRNRAGTLELKEDSRGLWGRIRVNREDLDAMNLYARVRRGDVDQCSFGFDILDEEVREDPGGRARWEIREVALYEVSVVTFPAYEETHVKARQRELGERQERETALWRMRMERKLKGEDYGA